MRLQAKRPVRVGERVLGGPGMLVCVPLLATEPGALIEQARRLGAMRADCIEWRADYLAGLTAPEIPGLLRQLAGAAGSPLLFTNRLRAEGGHAVQDEEHRVAILEAAAASGVPALVDIEMATPPPLAAAAMRAARATGVAVIRSWHDMAATPSRQMLLGTLRAMQADGADVVKVAVTPRTPDDVLALLDAGLEARRMFLETPAILMAMGPLGAVSRLGGHFGSDLTFAVGVEASAPGQLSLDLVRAALAAMGLDGAVR